jgi:hypothetical protein
VKCPIWQTVPFGKTSPFGKPPFGEPSFGKSTGYRSLRLKMCINFDENVLGYILGVFFTESSGHPAWKRKRMSSFFRLILLQVISNISDLQRTIHRFSISSTTLTNTMDVLRCRDGNTKNVIVFGRSGGGWNSKFAFVMPSFVRKYVCRL